MLFLFSYPPFQSIYNFIKTIKHGSVLLKYQRNTNYVTFVVYEDTTVYGTFIIEALKIDKTDEDFAAQLPIDIIFPKNPKSLIELLFNMSKIKVTIRYESSNDRTKTIQEFSRSNSLFNTSSIIIPSLENLICSFNMSLVEYKDLIEFSSDSHIVLEVEKDLYFDIVGKERKIIKTCQKHQDVPIKQHFSSVSFSKIKGLGSLVYNKEKVFNDINFEIYQSKNSFYIVLQSSINPQIRLFINPTYSEPIYSNFM